MFIGSYIPSIFRLRNKSIIEFKRYNLLSELQKPQLHMVVLILEIGQVNVVELHA